MVVKEREEEGEEDVVVVVCGGDSEGYDVKHQTVLV